MSKPGTIATNFEGKGDECMRQSFSVATGVSPRRLRYIPFELPDAEWWDEWQRLAAERGFKFVEFNPYVDPWPEGYWLAGVISANGEEHVVVMHGTSLYYDPAHERSRTPRKFIDALEVVPLD